MKTIEVTDEIYEFLINLSHEINNQDHRGTAMPYIFQIQTKEEVPAAEGCGTQAWIFDGSMIETQEEITAAISELKDIDIKDVTTDEDDREQILEDAGWRKINYEEKEVFQNAFLTSKACDEHIASNKHHYRKPVNYLSHSFRNPQLEKLFQFICGLTGKQIHR